MYRELEAFKVEWAGFAFEAEKMGASRIIFFCVLTKKRNRGTKSGDE